jgi:hypothetical protein
MPDAPERIHIRQIKTGLTQFVNGGYVPVMRSVLERELAGIAGEYVLASKADAQAEELRAELEASE